VYPVPVQGDGAARAIAAMLARASARAEVEVLLLVRGGGSIEDLWPFNEEGVARAIRAARLPVVVGVGHESDYTIADFAADVRAPTPTAAAELVAPDAAALARAVAGRVDRLRGAVSGRIGNWLQRLDYAARAFLAPRVPLAGLRARIGQLLLRAGRVPAQQCAAARSALAAHRERLQRRRPELGAMRQLLRDRSASLGRQANAALEQRRARLERLCAELVHLGPHAVLKRGYSIVRDADGRIITAASRLHVGQAVDIVFAEGGARARVESVAAGEPPREA
jgi:exodeoxyribonuclease VII large subunit